ncbi:MAG: ATPase, T2SS/T4P/T4SS family [Opitutales bacterium]
MPQSQLTSSLRKNLLLKIISRRELKPSDVDSVIEMSSEKIVELVEAQSMTFYLVVGNGITFKHVYYSPSLYTGDEAKERELEKKRNQLLSIELPLGTGIVGKAIEDEEPVQYSKSKDTTGEMHDMFEDTGFSVHSMLTVPLCGNRCVGAIQVLNKEPREGEEEREFNDQDLNTLLEVAEYVGPLIQRLVDPEYEMNDEAVARYTARFTGEKLVTDNDDLPVEEKLVEMTGETIIRQTGIFPVENLGPNSISVVMVNPYDYPNIDAFEKSTELSIDEISVAPRSLIESLTSQHLKNEPTPDTTGAEGGDISGLVDVIGEKYQDASEQVESGELEEESAPIVALANRIVEDAYVQGASDIHIEPQEKELLVRYRIDGVCKKKLCLPSNVTGPLVARFKIMCDLDIAEKRIPQDGRIVFKKFTKRNIDIDLRVATSPMNFGEKVVMRILDKSKSALPITTLGFSDENLEKYREIIKQPYGMILHCGPTGSGKSMTLFSALREIATPDINIQTAEDPIEYTIPGINQLQVKKKIGLDFAAALRSYLRMDPDVILVGEIRDHETAEISIEAALTGHLMLSTLHTNDAPSTIARFTDMGIEPFMISASLLVVCAQRLMRRVCPTCRLEYTAEGRELEMLRQALGPDWGPDTIYRASKNGCPKCGNIGMKGRIGIHELMTNSEELTRAINAKKETSDLKRIARATGMKTLHQDAMLKVAEGVSSVMEAISTVPPDMEKSE